MYIDEHDALSSILARLQLQAQVYSDGEFCGAWAVDTSGSRRMPFHLIGRGEAWLHIDQQPATRLTTGDLVVFPRDSQHVIAHCETLPQEELVNAPPTQDTGPKTNLICGFFEFENKSVWPLLDSLATVIVIDLADLSLSSNIRTLIDLMMAELNRRSPGFTAVINQLAYLLFVQILRHQITQGKIDTGLLSALFDPRISSALSGIHNRPHHPWSLTSLAQEASMGRSGFAKRFHEFTGMPPMQYLTLWRMQEAKNLLETTLLSTAQIAQRCGYESETAFRKAFKKALGMPPGQVRKDATLKSIHTTTKGARPDSV